MTTWSRGAGEITGISASDAVGKNILDLCTSESARAVLADTCGSALGGKTFAEKAFSPFGGGSVFLEVEPMRGERGAIAGGSLVLQAIDADSPIERNRHGFGDYLVGERNLTISTAWTYENNLQRLEKWLGMGADEIGQRDVRRFLRESDYHPATKNSTLVAVKAFMRFGLLEEFVSADKASPVLALRGPKRVLNPKRPLSLEEAKRLIKLAKRPNEVRLVYLGLYGGLRVTEMAAMDDVSWASLRGALVVFGKGRKVREVPIHPALEGKKDLILSNKTTAESLMTTCKSLSWYLSKAPEDQFSSHALRRTFATQLTEQRIHRDVTYTLLGHSLSTGATHYTAVTLSEMVNAVMALPY